MNSVMIQMYFGAQTLKDRFVRKIYNVAEGYNAPPLWAIVSLIVLAALAIIVVVAASIWCSSRGYKYFGVDWNRGSTGFVGVGCLK